MPDPMPLGINPADYRIRFPNDPLIEKQYVTCPWDSQIQEHYFAGQVPEITAARRLAQTFIRLEKKRAPNFNIAQNLQFEHGPTRTTLARSLNEFDQQARDTKLAFTREAFIAYALCAHPENPQRNTFLSSRINDLRVYNANQYWQMNLQQRQKLLNLSPERFYTDRIEGALMFIFCGNNFLETSGLQLTPFEVSLLTQLGYQSADLPPLKGGTILDVDAKLVRTYTDTIRIVIEEFSKRDLLNQLPAGLMANQPQVALSQQETLPVNASQKPLVELL